MRNRVLVIAVAAAAAVAFFFGGAAAQDPGGMPEWMNPAPEHAKLEKLVGEWNLAVTHWAIPGAPPMVVQAKSTFAPILAGLYVEERVKSGPFEGRGVLGYDTVRKQWVSTWIDNSSPVPSIVYSTEKDGVMTGVSEEPDLTTGKLKKVRTDVAWQNDDQFTVTMTELGPDGKDQHRRMQIVYKRKVAAAAAPEADRDEDEGCD